MDRNLCLDQNKICLVFYLINFSLLIKMQILHAAGPKQESAPGVKSCSIYTDVQSATALPVARNAIAPPFRATCPWSWDVTPSPFIVGPVIINGSIFEWWCRGYAIVSLRLTFVRNPLRMRWCISWSPRRKWITAYDRVILLVHVHDLLEKHEDVYWKQFTILLGSEGQMIIQNFYGVADAWNQKSTGSATP